MKKQTWQQWVRAIERDRSTPSLILRGTLAALTGQDVRAISAIVACWELYASSDADGQRGALAAVRALLPALQASVRPLARELIPFALDWSDRERLWPLVASDRPEENARTLKSCPFCGSADVKVERKREPDVICAWYEVECEQCGARGPCSPYEAEAKILWDKHMRDVSYDQVIER